MLNVTGKHTDLHSVGDQILNLLQLLELVLALDVVTVGDNHPSHQTSERSDTVPLPNTDDGGVDVRGTSFQSAVRVGNGATAVVVEVGLNVAADDTTERSHEVVHLSWRRAADGVGDADSVDADLVDGAVEGKKINQVGPEAVLGRESDLDALGLDELDNLDSGVLQGDQHFAQMLQTQNLSLP